MKHLFLLLLAFVAVPLSASAQSAECIDPSLIDPEVGCLEIWDPVCGCDGVTYSNSCYAQNHGGVTSWTAGECDQTSVPPCTDLADVDFGDCDMALGVAVVNGQCAFLSGCDWTVGGTDYSGAFFDSMQECQNCVDVEVVEPCTDLAGLDFGQCDMFLGYAVVGDQCGWLSGCGWQIGNTDYSGAFFPSLQECQSSCLEPEIVEPCTDLAGVDFGPCLAFMGVGVFEGQCQYVSGCGPLVGNIDYSAAVYSTMEECLPCLEMQTAEPCTDLAGVDFGMCAAVLGVGIIDNTCVGISGCGTTVGNVDYSPAFYSSMEECQACITSAGGISPAHGLTIFPNPGDGRAVVRSDMTAGVVRVTDLSGRTVLVSNLVNGRLDLDAGHLPSGTYLLTVEGEGAVRTARLTIR